MVNKSLIVVVILVTILIAPSISTLTWRSRLPLENLPAAVKLLEVKAVAATDSTCKGLWYRDGGTLCNRDQLLMYRNQEVNLTKEALLTITKMISLWHKISPDILSTGVFNEVILSPIESEWLNTTRDQGFEAESKAQALQCWDYMDSVRSSALCYACSAQNYHYFLGSKALILPADWNTIASKCSLHLFTMLAYFESSFVLMKGLIAKLATYRTKLNSLEARLLLEAKIAILKKEIEESHSVILGVTTYMKDNLNNNPSKVYATFFKLTRKPAIAFVERLVLFTFNLLSPLYIQVRSTINWVETHSSYSRLLHFKTNRARSRMTTTTLTNGTLQDYFNTDAMIATSFTQTGVIAVDPQTQTQSTSTNTNGMMAPVDTSNRFP